MSENTRRVQENEPLFTDERGRLVTRDGMIVSTHDPEEIELDAHNMANNEITFNKSDLLKELTLTVTVTESPGLGLRWQLCFALIRLAIWVGGFGGVEFGGIEDFEKEKPNETH